MTGAQILKALDRYIADFKASAITPKRFPAEKSGPTTGEAMEHAYWMALETRAFAESSPHKAMRWLCFIQGVMWSNYDSTIDEFKDDNRSPP